jgi:general stress protein YciG
MTQRYDDYEQPQFDPERDALDTAGDAKSVEMPSRSRRGFAGMSEEKRRAIASKGGQSQGKQNNPGNFANNREKAVAAGQKGGQNSHGGGRMSRDADERDSDMH